MPIFLLITVPRVKAVASLDYMFIPEVGEIRPFDWQIKEVDSQNIESLYLQTLRDTEQAKKNFFSSEYGNT